MTLKTKWEVSENTKSGIIAYLCYDSSLVVFKTRRNASRTEKTANVIMFSDVDEVSGEDDVIASNERVYYYMRLPYTARMLQARYERGADVPTWFAALATETEAA